MANIFKRGNNVEINEGGVTVMLIPFRAFRVEPEADHVTMRDIECNRTKQYAYGDVNNGVGAPIGTPDDVVDYLSQFVGFSPASGGSGAMTFEVADNRTQLPNGTTLGQLGYARNSEGTQWLPGTIGGSYYPAGWYTWDGSMWISDRNAIAEELENTLTLEDGVGVAMATINPSGQLILTLTDGSSLNAGVVVGADGATGAVGPQGPIGPQGPQGDPGTDGADGNDGAQGIQGIQGPIGPIGPAGNDGNDGNDGLSAYEIWLNNGNTGTEPDFLNSLEGAQGAQGIQGPIGPMGVPGSDGADGQDGAPGTNGVDGADGADGAVGPQGIQGPVGPAGADSTVPGPAGPQGDPGPQGPAGNDGATGADGPQGIQGPIGNDGPQGPAGADGTNGTNGTNGSDGADGLSAYEVAVANGFVGTEPQWLTSLEGADGAQGPQGIQGIQGPAGLDGNDGADGAQGIQGDPGPQGPIGLTGPAGSDGADGAQGPQGDPGVDGVDGAVGPQGPAGPAGADGVDGDSFFTDVTNGVRTDEQIGIGIDPDVDGILQTCDDTGKDWINEQIGGNGSAFTLLRKANGTKAAKTGLLANEKIGGFAAFAHDGTDYGTSGEVAFQTTEDQSPTNRGAQINFLTTANGSNVQVTNFIIQEDGDKNFMAKRAVNMADPINPQDGATKAYVAEQFLEATINGNQQLPAGTAYQDIVDFDAPTPNTLAGGTFNQTTGVFTCNEAGIYSFHFQTTMDQYDGNNRTSARVRLNLNGALVKGTEQIGYHRQNLHGFNNYSFTKSLSLIPGNTVRVQARNEHTARDHQLLENSTLLRITKIKT